MPTPTYEHREERLCHISPANGVIGHVSSCADNRRVLALVNRDDGTHRIFHGGAQIAEYGPLDSLHFSLSFDGRKAATGHAVEDGERLTHRIAINGAPAYDVPYSTLHHMEWIDNDRLAWECWSRDDMDATGIRYYLNGVDQGDGFQFEPFIARRDRHGIRVQRGNEAYVIDHRGRIGMRWAVDGSADRSRHDRFRPVGDDGDGFGGTYVRREEPQPQRREDGCMQMQYRGAPFGPVFDELGSGGMSRLLATSAEGARVAYVGMRLPRVVRYAGRKIIALLERDETRRHAQGKKGESRWLLPFAILLSPYGGPLHALAEASERFYPVDNGDCWEKGWHYVSDLHYAAGGQLIALCHEGLRKRVVIDQAAGPPYDGVWNIEQNERDYEVSYIASRGGDVFRVTVAL